MARRLTSKFGVADGLFADGEQMANGAERERSPQQVQDTQQEQQAQQVGRTIGSTQGKKGEHLKRINMAFSDANYEFITIEGRRSGARSTTAFVNQIIDEYRRNYDK